jgi:hypothetical protein
MKQRPSMRAAINAMCKRCVYDPLAGGSCLQQIIDCSIPSCPLYPVRRQRKKRHSEPSSAEGMPTYPVDPSTRQSARGGALAASDDDL